MSAGVCELGDALAGESLFARADRALYRAKQAGRDRVVSWHDSMQTAAR